MAKGIKRKLEKVLGNVKAEIHLNAQGGIYASALSGEGYAGGYGDAIIDIGLALNGVRPCRGRRFWEGVDFDE